MRGDHKKRGRDSGKTASSGRGSAAQLGRQTHGSGSRVVHSGLLDKCCVTHASGDLGNSSAPAPTCESTLLSEMTVDGAPWLLGAVGGTIRSAPVPFPRGVCLYPLALACCLAPSCTAPI